MNGEVGDREGDDLPSQSVNRKVESSLKLPSSNIKRNSVPVALSP